MDYPQSIEPSGLEYYYDNVYVKNYVVIEVNVLIIRSGALMYVGHYVRGCVRVTLVTFSY